MMISEFLEQGCAGQKLDCQGHLEVVGQPDIHQT
jgi:hypothetical protein